MLTYYRCQTCLRCFATEEQILDHQSLWSQLHRIDPEIDEHDGTSWTKVAVQPGERIEYQGWSATLVGAADREVDECDFFYEKIDRRQYRGSVFDMYIPPVSEQLVRAWAAATALGDLDSYEQEVDVREYSRWLTRRWYDQPERLDEERHTMLAMMAAVSLYEATRRK